MKKFSNVACVCGCCYRNGKKFRECRLSQEEVDHFNHLKAIDPKKLAAKVPTWARPVLLPKPFKFVAGAKPVYPAWTYRKAA